MAIADDDKSITRVAAAATTNITISTGLQPGANIGSHVLVAGDLVLLKGQTDSSQNGLYRCSDDPGRDWDYGRHDTGGLHGSGGAFDIFPGMLVSDESTDKLYRCTSQRGGILDTTPLTFTEFVGLAGAVGPTGPSGPAGSAGPVGPTGPSGSANLATTTEVLTGTDTAKTVTPDTLAALWEKGTTLVPAATLSFGEGGYFIVGGTPTTVTDVDFATPKDGRMATVLFNAAATGTVLTHNISTLILPGSVNITTEGNDRACFVQHLDDLVICLWYVRGASEALRLDAGTWTPVITHVANIDATTAYVSSYFRVGNAVSVYGKVSIDANAGTVGTPVSTIVELTLPVVSNFSQDIDAGGSFTTGGAVAAGRIAAAPSTDRLLFTIFCPSTVNINYHFSGSYTVI